MVSALGCRMLEWIPRVGELKEQAREAGLRSCSTASFPPSPRLKYLGSIVNSSWRCLEGRGARRETCISAFVTTSLPLSRDSGSLSPHTEFDQILSSLGSEAVSYW